MAPISRPTDVQTLLSIILREVWEARTMTAERLGRFYRAFDVPDANIPTAHLDRLFQLQNENRSLFTQITREMVRNPVLLSLLPANQDDVSDLTDNSAAGNRQPEPPLGAWVGAANAQVLGAANAQDAGRQNLSRRAAEENLRALAGEHVSVAIPVGIVEGQESVGYAYSQAPSAAPNAQGGD